MNELVTIVGASYFEPIANLLEKLEKHYKGHEGEIQAGTFENGYAASICLLSVVCLESYTMRARYIHGASGDELNKLPVTKYLNKIYQDYPYFDEANEVFVVRDLLAHNHLLKVTYDTGDTVGMKKTGSVRISSGDKKFSANVCTDTEKTMVLGLNTSPILIGYKDAIIILKTVWENLLFLESKDRNQCYVSHLHVKH
jgi:hypothetical protein